MRALMRLASVRAHPRSGMVSTGAQFRETGMESDLARVLREEMKRVREDVVMTSLGTGLPGVLQRQLIETSMETCEEAIAAGDGQKIHDMIVHMRGYS